MRLTRVLTIGISNIVIAFPILCQTPIPPKDKPADEVTVTEKENKGCVKIQLGKNLKIKLDVSPGTGYSWNLEADLPEFLELDGETYFVPKAEELEEKIVGKTELQIYQFTAQKVGSFKLKLDYKRQWEEDAKPERTFEITVIVVPKIDEEKIDPPPNACKEPTRAG